MTNTTAELKAVAEQEEQRRLSKQQLLQAHIVEKDIEIPSLGTVRVRSMSHKVRQELRQKAGFNTDKYDENYFTNLIIIHSVIDPDLTEDDIPAVEQWSGDIYDSLVTELTMLNMLGQRQDLKKDSSQTESSD
jgi:hypothetical protein